MRVGVILWSILDEMDRRRGRDSSPMAECCVYGNELPKRLAAYQSFSSMQIVRLYYMLMFPVWTQF